MDAIRRTNTPHHARGFSLIELLVTIAVVAAISSMMFPAFGKVRQAALRLMCQNNMRSIFIGLDAFREDHNGRMPDSVYAPRDDGRGKPMRPQELMALTGDETDLSGNRKWDGLGLLFGRSEGGGGRYVSDARVFYCPAHGSVHTFERYENALQSARTSIAANSKSTVYANYHYWDAWNRAALERQKNGRTKGIHPIAQDVILTDGMRTQPDFSHRFGCNALTSDGSLQWIGGNRLEFAIRALPSNEIEIKPFDRQVEAFERIVSAIETAR